MSSNVSKGLAQLTDSLEKNYINVKNLRSSFEFHEVDENAHENVLPSFLVYRSNRSYLVGERVYVKEFPNYLVLECIKSGKTSSTRPNFSNYLTQYNNSTI